MFTGENANEERTEETPALAPIVPEGTPFRVFSFGGGQQSMAALVLQAQGIINFEAFVFADVGPRSEDERTQVYLRDIVLPYAEAHNIRFEVVRKTYKGQPDDILDWIDRTESTIGIPVRMGGGAPGDRSCTRDYKIRPIHKWIKAQVPKNGLVELGIGFGAEEMRRVKLEENEYHLAQGSMKFGYWRRKVYPLIDLNMNRADSQALIAKAGLPVPPPSSCWFCPFHSRAAWIELKRTRPELFAQAVELEEKINKTRAGKLRDRVYLHPALQPLDIAVGDQMSMFDVFEDDMNCGSGYCGV